MSKRPAIPALTSLRFFFALAVYFHHCYFMTRSESKAVGDFYQLFFYEGYVGVSFFFVLSGFILAYNYQDRFVRGEQSRRAFWWARFARVYPLHLLLFLVMIPVDIAEEFADGVGQGVLKVVSQVTLTQSWFLDPGVATAFNAPAWSISDEAFFYALFPALALGAARAWRRYGQRALWGLLPLGLLPLAMALSPTTWYDPVYYFFPPVRLAEFVLGIALFNVLRDRPVPSVRRSNYEETGAVALLFLFWLLHREFGTVYRYSVYYWTPMVALIAAFARGRGRLSGWLAHPRWILLGEISFAFYLVHRPLMRYYSKVRDKFFAYDFPAVDVVVYLVLSLIASYFLYRFFERPVNRWLRTK